MQAVRIQPAAAPSKPYSVDNPAPSTALKLHTIDIPQPKEPNEIVVRVNATTVIRDTLTWPEMYSHPHAIPGHDFAGMVFSIHPQSGDDSTHSFKVGDEVYGMVHADRGGCWAQYVVVKADECAMKPKIMSWSEAATVPLSALTAWQALFHHGGVSLPSILSGQSSSGDEDASAIQTGKRKVFITGASGGVGIWLVQLAKLAGCHVVAGTTSKTRSEDFLKELGADEVVKYDEAFQDGSASSYDTVIDGVAGTVLENCWRIVKDEGYLVSIHSASFTFVEDHRKSKIANGKDKVNALFFIVEPSGSDLMMLSKLIEGRDLKTFVGKSFPLAEIHAAYDLSHGQAGTKGKLVLLPWQ